MIENTKIVNLPLNARNPFMLALLVPGRDATGQFGQFHGQWDGVVHSQREFRGQWRARKHERVPD